MKTKKTKKPKNKFDKLVNWSTTETIISIHSSPIYANIMISKLRVWSIIKTYQKPKNI